MPIFPTPAEGRASPRPRRIRGPARDAGYTLLEALVVVAILGLMAAALAGFGGTPPAQHHDTVREVVATLRTARAETLRTRTATPVAFDSDARRYGIGQPEQPLDADWAVLDRHGASADPAVLRFFPDGSSSGGTVMLTTAGQTSHIRVHWLTGTIAVETPDG